MSFFGLNACLFLIIGQMGIVKTVYKSLKHQPVLMCEQNLNLLVFSPKVSVTLPMKESWFQLKPQQILKLKFLLK